DAGERNFYRASKTRRFLTIAAGIVFNLVFAGLCFTAVLMAPTPSQVISGGALASAGVGNGATITAINGQSIRHDTPQDVVTDLHAATGASDGAPMHITYQASDGGTHMIDVRPQLVVTIPTQTASLAPGLYVVTAVNGKSVGTGAPSSLLGSGGPVAISGYEEGAPANTFTEASISGVRAAGSSSNTIQAMWLIGFVAGFDGEPFPTAVSDGFRAIPDIVRTEAVGVYQLVTVPSLGGVNGPNGLLGPVGIAQQTVAAAQGGIFGEQGLVWWIGFVSLAIGIFNVLPIPFLDGGKIFFILLEAVRHKRADPRIEAVASAIGLALLVLLLIYVTIGNVSRL
ncbi:MAG: RIP metalloprotease, partial [Candidatus Dormibacteraeota bacterium]|nr:RIP metalloprotease [Candidatus Dormibacteraeota bacterium]